MAIQCPAFGDRYFTFCIALEIRSSRWRRSLVYHDGARFIQGDAVAHWVSTNEPIETPTDTHDRRTIGKRQGYQPVFGEATGKVTQLSTGKSVFDHEHGNPMVLCSLNKLGLALMVGELHRLVIAVGVQRRRGNRVETNLGCQVDEVVLSS